MNTANSTAAISIQGSLTKRLFSVATICQLIGLLLVGAALLLLFERYMQKRFDEALLAQMHDLIAVIEPNEQGQLQLNWQPSSPKFNQPFSGWYWQVFNHQQVLFQSSSWYSEHNQPLLPQQLHDEQQNQWLQFIDANGDELRAVVQSIKFAENGEHYHFIVAGPTADIHQDVIAFGKVLALTLLALAAMMALLMFWQTHQVLKPVNQLAGHIARIRRGEAQHLQLTLPQELAIVAQELNTLLEHNASILERARLQAANLAHALKNPLSILRNGLGQLDHNSAKVIEEQLDKLSQNAQTHLSRARLAGSMQHLAAQTNIAEALSDILFSMELLYKTRALTLDFRCHANYYFRGDQHDLEEVLGNLIDNACKWARSRVHVAVDADIEQHRISILIDDDGPGIPTHKHASVFRPGQRLDETIEGSGLGMHIVQDVILLYGGTIALSQSPWQGTRVQIELPGGKV